jgi:predicted TIM-barrel fold metal-dependent hydrolase
MDSSEVQKIIDFHFHIGRTEKCSVGYSVKGCLGYMRTYGISETVVMPNLSSNYTSSSLNKDFLKQFPIDKLHPILLADQRDKETFRQVEENDIVGIKVHPSVFRCAVNSVYMTGFWELCKYKNIFALIHCGRDELSNFTNLLKVANDWPEITFIAAHLGGGATDLVEKALQNDIPQNVYMDISASKVPRLIRQAVSVLGSDKILFGSDEPYADYRVTKYCLDLAGVSEDIYSKNAEKVLCSVKY